MNNQKTTTTKVQFIPISKKKNNSTNKGKKQKQKIERNEN